ncbi:hypothetical protein HDU84_001171 [Entophlyctis sp. JEL0112]|nr:hypothetical protein HDU84_001171 [Entophlyctis sp. JEL0112]
MADDDFGPSTSSVGYKAGAKKTAAELAEMDAADGIPLILVGLIPAFFKKIDIGSEAIAALDSQIITIKEGVEYRLKVKFRVNHDVVSGLKYMHVVKRSGLKVDKADEMLGSYGPSADVYEKKFPIEEAPSGMLARGRYSVKSRFIDDDQHIYLEWSWSFDIKKDWE